MEKTNKQKTQKLTHELHHDIKLSLYRQSDNHSICIHNGEYGMLKD